MLAQPDLLGCLIDVGRVHGIAQLRKAIRPVTHQLVGLDWLAVHVEHKSEEMVVGSGVVEVVRRAKRLEVGIAGRLGNAAILARRLPGAITRCEDILDPVDDASGRIVRPLLAGDDFDVEFGSPFTDHG